MSNTPHRISTQKCLATFNFSSLQELVYCWDIVNLSIFTSSVRKSDNSTQCKELLECSSYFVPLLFLQLFQFCFTTFCYFVVKMSLFCSQGIWNHHWLNKYNKVPRKVFIYYKFQQYPQSKDMIHLMRWSVY